ncbi:MAG TPA: DUF2982 domain-containing protein [Rheinheimera sp.]|uniref:DUF2982 domain-containing protein n=1 Tax=Rheinheimera sp. TaxID=1869214 RepID=UPI002F93CB03
MSINLMSPVNVQGAASRGGAAVLLCSAAVAIILVISLSWVEQLQLWHALGLIGAGLGMFSGWAKLAEPKFFLQYDEQGVRYQHRHGCWVLPWSSFLYSGVPQYNSQTLGYIGFKVTDYDSFLQQLPLRLAVRIMTEQRALYIEAVRQGCVSGQCASELLTETGSFATATQRYNGIKAAFASRMKQLAAQTGFDVFVPVSLTPGETQQLCLQINQARLQLIQNTVT